MDGLVQRWPAGTCVRGADDGALQFETRLAECSALAVRVAYSVVRNQSDAEDVAQEAFIRAYRRLAALRDPGKFRAWLLRITWRLALDWRRAHKRRATREDNAARDIALVGDGAADADARAAEARLWALIDGLPDRLRLVVVLSAIEGHGVREVAALLGVPEGTVKSRLFDARRRLQEQLS